MRNHPVGFYKIIAIAEDEDITRGLYRPHIAGVAGSGTLGCIYYPQGIGGIVAFDHSARAVGTAVIANEHLKTGVTGLGCEGIKLLRNIVGAVIHRNNDGCRYGLGMSHDRSPFTCSATGYEFPSVSRSRMRRAGTPAYTP